MATARKNIRRWEGMQVKGHQREGKSYKETKRSHQSSSLHRLGELRASCLQSGSLGTEPTMGICEGVTEEQLSESAGNRISIGQGKYRTRYGLHVRLASHQPHGERWSVLWKGARFYLHVSWSLALLVTQRKAEILQEGGRVGDMQGHHPGKRRLSDQGQILPKTGRGATVGH